MPTIKLLEEKYRVNLHDLRSDNGFLDLTPETQAIKGKIDKSDFIKNFCAKDTIKRVKKNDPQNEIKYLQIIYVMMIY